MPLEIFWFHIQAQQTKFQLIYLKYAIVMLKLYILHEKCMKLALLMAKSRKGSDQFQNSFFGLFPDMKATNVPNFKSIGPSLRD
jgi:hypothetical protein